MSASWSAWARRRARHPFVKAGLPLVIFTMLGFIALTRFVQGKKEIEELSSGKRSITKRKYDLEEDYKNTMRKLAEVSDNQDGGFELKRIERPEGM